MATTLLFIASLFKVTKSISLAQQYSKSIAKNRVNSLDSLSTDSYVLYVQRSTGEQTPPRHNTLNVLKSTELSRFHVRDVSTISAATSPELMIVTIEFNTNEPTILYGYGRQDPIIPSSLNDLNLPPNFFIVLATMAVVQPPTVQYDEKDCPLSPVLSELFNLDATGEFECSKRLRHIFRRRNILI